MKNLILISLISLFIFSCTSNKSLVLDHKKEETGKLSDTVRIANDELKYEVIIFEPGFNSWLNSQAKPRGFYSENYLEGRNRIYVSEWNRRVMQPQQYKSDLYDMQINYDSSIHYGYEVNYLIYNYFIFFQLNYKQQLSGFVPRN
jgi:hypothetical protein